MAARRRAKDELTFVFSDIVGSTRLWERAPGKMRTSLARHDELIRRIVEEHHGRVFKTVGDASCCAFAAAADAVRAALAAQHAIAKQRWPAQIGPLRVRIGIHTGRAFASGDDYFGPALNRVARLMATAHGGQTVLSASTAKSVDGALTDRIHLRNLGSHRLRDLAQPETIFEARADGLTEEFPALNTLDSRPNNLPSQISSFVGRTSELALLRDLAAKNRLVTVTGPGGIGKTRLALQAAAEISTKFEDGCWLVRFADIGDETLVAQTVAAVLHVREDPAERLELTLARELSDKRMLLILDNAEHLLQPIARLVRDLSRECSGMHMMVTSREPTHIAGEQVVRIGPMRGDDEAEHLFLERAQSAAGDRRFLAGDPLVKSICTHLDGIPLAIELAAARLGTVDLKQLDTWLRSDLKSLASKDSSEEARHRTLTATIQWSYRMLDSEQQRLFARLAIFDGGFTLQAFDAVAYDSAFDANSVDMLESLVDKSFVSAQFDGSDVRYYLLETLRRFAGQRLDESRERDLIAERHFAFFGQLAASRGSWTNPEEERAYVQRFERELPNLRAALTYGFGHSEKDAGIEMLLKVAQHWQLRGNLAEARSWLETAIGFGDRGNARSFAALLRRAATIATLADDYPQAREWSEQSLAVYKDLDDAAGIAEATHNLAVIEHKTGDVDAAYEMYCRAYEGFAAANHDRGMLTALANQAMILVDRGKLDEARECFAKSEARCRSMGDSDALGSVLMRHAELEFEAGKPDEAARLYGRALEIKMFLGSQVDVAGILSNVASLSLDQHDLSSAHQAAAKALKIALNLDSKWEAVECLEAFAAILFTWGDEPAAIDALAGSDYLRQQTNYSLPANRRLQVVLVALRERCAETLRQRTLVIARADDWRKLATELLSAKPPTAPLQPSS